MTLLRGGCHCGNVALEVQLSRAVDSYRPRVCDCEFCRKHGAAYVSDPDGALLLRVRDAARLGSYRQGSGAAEMLVCRTCGVLLGALYRDGERIYGVVNSRSLEAPQGLGAEQPVSPQTLGPEQKQQRWRQLWFANVTIVEAH
jgi:hypothetical protein